MTEARRTAMPIKEQVKDLRVLIGTAFVVVSCTWAACQTYYSREFLALNTATNVRITELVALNQKQYDQLCAQNQLIRAEVATMRDKIEMDRKEKVDELKVAINRVDETGCQPSFKVRQDMSGLQVSVQAMALQIGKMDTKIDKLIERVP